MHEHLTVIETARCELDRPDADPELLQTATDAARKAFLTVHAFIAESARASAHVSGDGSNGGQQELHAQVSAQAEQSSLKT